jgi:chromosome segregation protein
MRVSRLEIFGFKSFMERLVLPLEGGITGVVGPNGCGKSNIVDALRWVLGETRAKSLRGGILEDVIFNGTENLRPLGLAEVSITLRSSTDNFFEDVNTSNFEAQLLASEAALDDLSEDSVESVDLKNTEEQSSRPNLTVIEGNLGKEIVEEVTDQNQNLNTSEVENQEENLSTNEAVTDEISEPNSKQALALISQHFSWLKGVNEVQVTRRLYRSGESEFFINKVPCRLKDLKELFRAVGLGPRSYTIVAQGEVGRIVTSKPEERRSILEEAAGVQGFRDKIAASNRRLEETDINISRLVDIIKEVDRQVASLKRQASKAKNRQALKDEIAEIEKQLYSDALYKLVERSKVVNQILAEQNNLENELNEKVTIAKEAEELQRNELISIDLSGDNLRAKIDTIKEELNNRLRIRSDMKAKLSELEAFKKSRESEILKLEDRKLELSERQIKSETYIEDLRKEEITLSQQIASLDLTVASRFNELTKERDALRSEIQKIDSELRKSKEELITRQSNLSSIEEQIIATSPLAHLQKAIASQNAQSEDNIKADLHLLIDNLNIDAKYTKALQAVLNEKAAFIVSNDPHSLAKEYVQAVVSDQSKRGMGIGVVRANLGSGNSSSSTCPMTKMLDLITTSDISKGALNKFLENVHVAEDINQAFDYFKNNSNDDNTILVTLIGEIVTAHSFYALPHEAGLLQLKQRADQLRVEINQYLNICNEKENILTTATNKLYSLEKESSELLAIVQERQGEASDLSAKLGSVRGRLQSENQQVERLQKDCQNIVSQIEESLILIKQYGEQIESIQAEIALIKTDDEVVMQEEIKLLQTEYQALEETRSQGRKQLAELAKQAQEQRQALDKVRAIHSDCLLEQQKLDLEASHIKERTIEEYGEDFYNLLFAHLENVTALADEDREELKDRVAKIKSRISREGEVDPTSIENLVIEEARLAELISQRDDLESAAKTLKKTIEKLTNTSIQRFISTFEAVRKNFTMLIPRLFGGGKGSIELSDPNNPLESGIDIVVRPPGKKLKSLELLSGGEKAMCAIGLVFAMFMVRPSPLCILDEVDAPLDEANLLRFVNMVKEMSKQTQFIMITHNKGSMNTADRLVGVTMPEPGASRIISVSLQEAYEQVA